MQFPHKSVQLHTFKQRCLKTKFNPSLILKKLKYFYTVKSASKLSSNVCWQLTPMFQLSSGIISKLTKITAPTWRHISQLPENIVFSPLSKLL